VQAAPIVNPSTVDYDTLTFLSRTVVVRYSCERSQLNEGVHWRLTLPSVDLSDIGIEGEEDASITCPEPVNIEVALVFAPFSDMTGKDAYSDIEEIIPTVPKFSKIAMQVLQIPEVRSGVHSYFPIHFDRSSFVRLDAMVHVAATGVHFPVVAAALDAANASQVSAVDNPLSGDVLRTADPEAPTFVCNPFGSLFEQSDGENGISDSRVQNLQLRAPETTTITEMSKSPIQRIKESLQLSSKKNTEQSSSVLNRITSPKDGISPSSSSSLNNQDPEFFLSRVSDILLSNRKQLYKCTQPFVAIYDHKEDNEDEMDVATLERIMSAESDHIPRTLFGKQRVLSSTTDELCHRTSICNGDTSARWSTFLSLLPQIESQMKAVLAADFLPRVRGFWKLSLMIHTCNASNITRPHPDDDTVCREHQQLLSREGADIDSALKNFSSSSCKNKAARHLPGRTLDVADSVYCEIAKLPVLLVQQYVSPDVSIGTSRRRAGFFIGCLDEILVSQSMSRTGRALYSCSYIGGSSETAHCSDDLLVTSPHAIPLGAPRAGIHGGSSGGSSSIRKSRDIHLVIMQHGFEGCYYVRAFSYSHSFISIYNLSMFNSTSVGHEAPAKLFPFVISSLICIHPTE